MSNSFTSPVASRYPATTEACVIDGLNAPATFSTLEEEYKSIRDRSAISDQSHFSKFQITGSDAVDFLSFVNLPDIARLPIGKTASSFMLTETGGVFCECYIVSSGDSYLLLTEGRSKAEVTEYLEKHVAAYDAKIKDITNDYAFLELDGPYAWEVLKDLIGVKILGLRYLETLENQKIGSAVVEIIRAGKTGEFGYCLLVSKEQAVDCWDTLLKAGERYQMLPVGFEALDLCRLENRFPNLRSDCASVANPFEMNCRVMFDREKGDHLGREAIESLTATGPKKRIVGFAANDDSSAVAEIGSKLTIDGEVVGEVVNTGFSYMLGKSIGLALINNDLAYVGVDFMVGPSNRTVTTVAAPFVYNKSLTIRPQEHSFHSKS